MLVWVTVELTSTIGDSPLTVIVCPMGTSTTVMRDGCPACS